MKSAPRELYGLMLTDLGTTSRALHYETQTRPTVFVTSIFAMLRWISHSLGLIQFPINQLYAHSFTPCISQNMPPSISEATKH